MIALDCEREALLAEARDRVMGRREVTCIAARSPAAGQELDCCLEAGWSCAQALARPAAAVLPLDPGALEREFPGWRAGRGASSCAPEAVAFVYLVTCGYDSRTALQWLGGDYASYHFQDAFARELVFALGRQVGRQLRAGHPGQRFTREVVGSGCGVADGRGQRWDPRTVAGLLRRVGGDTLGVSATGGAALAPLHSLLGVMTCEPPRRAPSADHLDLARGRRAGVIRGPLQPGNQE
jgi:hypothetical protein